MSKSEEFGGPASSSPQSRKRLANVYSRSMNDNIAADLSDVEFIWPFNPCPHVKLITLANIYGVLETLEPRVGIDPSVAEKASRSVERMLLPE